ARRALRDPPSREGCRPSQGGRAHRALGGDRRHRLRTGKERAGEGVRGAGGEAERARARQRQIAGVSGGGRGGARPPGGVDRAPQERDRGGAAAPARTDRVPRRPEEVDAAGCLPLRREVATASRGAANLAYAYPHRRRRVHSAPTTAQSRTRTFQLSQSGLLVRCPTSTRSGSRQGSVASESDGSSTRPFVADAMARRISGRGAASISSREAGATTNASSASPMGVPSARFAVTVAL